MTSVGIEPTTSGLDLPSLCRLSYEVGQRKSGTIMVVNRGEEKARVHMNVVPRSTMNTNGETCQMVKLSICLVLPECLSVKICCISPSDSGANRDGPDAESRFPLFFSFSASFKNSSLREKVVILSSFWDWWAESLFVSIIVAKYNIFPRPNNGRSREKKTILVQRFAHAISLQYRDFEHAYVH